jgi:ABC-type multidrug transport system fused ATPase/permease subunit
MLEVFSQLNVIFDRRTKQILALAMLGSTCIAAMDTAAIALVLPLIELATGSESGSSVVGVMSEWMGTPDQRTLTITLTVCVVGLFILKDVGSATFNWWMNGFNYSQRVRTSARLLRHFLTAPYTLVSRRSSAELARTMNDSVSQVFNFTVAGLVGVVTNGIAIVAIVVALMIVAPLPTLALVAYFAVAAGIYGVVVKPKASAAGAQMAEATMEAWRYAFGSLGATKELHIRGTQERFVRQYEAASMKATHAARVATFLGGLPKYVLEILFILAVGLILLIGMATSPSGSAGGAIGLLGLLVAAGFRVLPSVTGLIGSISSIRVGSASLDLVHAEVVATNAADDRSEGNAAQLRFEDVLRVENVTFRYPESMRDVLTSVTLDVPRGQSLAIVGGSGAGKTTLVDIILGLHRPTSGRVTVDGVDVAERLPSWRKSVGYVPQDVFVLEASLAENVAFDQDEEDISPAALREALRHSQLETLAQELPHGVATQLGERGTRLSGGQRQRVGIARALFRQPRLLVLDEATSALDNETEHRISSTIGDLQGNITVIIVAHRLSTVRHADQIVFLDGGRVAHRGTFDELCLQSAEFARLVELGSLAPLDTTATPK